MKSRIRLGELLAFSAVLVTLPRHLVAQLHQAGMSVPAAGWWAAAIGVSSIAWAFLEALTLFHLLRAYTQTRRRHLLALMFTILAAIAATNAPSLVADSAGLTLTGLVGVASIAHWGWAVASIAATLLVVVAAGAADAATVAVNQRIDALVDAIDARQMPAQAVAAQQVTVNVSQNTPPEAIGSDSSHDAAPLRITAQTETDRAVERALRDGLSTSTAIGGAIGITPQAVRMTTAWKRRQEVIG